MKRVTLLSFGGLALAAALGAAASFIPVKAGGITGTLVGQKLPWIAAVVYLVVQAEAALLFLAGLKSFKTKLRISYIILCIAIFLFIVAQVQIPVTTISWALWWSTSGMVTVPYLFSSLFAYWGMVRFARLLGIKGPLTRFRYVLPGSIILAALGFIFFPVHLSPVMPTVVGHKTFTAIIIWMICFSALAAYYSARIRQVMGATYDRAMLWLAVALWGCTLAFSHFLALQIIGYDNWYGLNALESIPLTMMSLLMVKAGYEFWKVTTPDVVARTNKNASPLDVVIYVAGLATSRGAINPILDRVRQISADLTPGVALSPQNQEALAKVYLDLESYLVDKEPLRTFTRDELRNRIARMFPHNQDLSPAFWRKLV